MPGTSFAIIDVLRRSVVYEFDIMVDRNVHNGNTINGVVFPIH